jgi:hypothetical protein
VHWKIGSVPVGGTVEVMEFDHARDMVWTGITGMTVRGRFPLHDARAGRTEVTFSLTDRTPGGLLGLLADCVAARQVSRTLEQSLKYPLGPVFHSCDLNATVISVAFRLGVSGGRLSRRIKGTAQREALSYPVATFPARGTIRRRTESTASRSAATNFSDCNMLHVWPASTVTTWASGI